MPLSLLLTWLIGTLLWWGLAFPPVAEPPAWLARAQAVCFGTPPGGLPAPYGWGALVAAPLGMLSLLLAGWGADLQSALRALAAGRTGRWVLTAMSVLVLAQTTWVAWGVATSTPPANPGEPITQAMLSESTSGALPAGYLRLNRPAPAFSLLDQTGRPAALSDWRGSVVVLTFAFAHCTTVCPVTTHRVAQALAASSDLQPVGAVITLDAWRDTPAALKALAARWGLPEQMRLLTGDVATVNALLDEYAVSRSRDRFTGEIDHVALVYVIDGTGRIAYAFADPSAAWLAEAVRRAARPVEG